MGRTDNLGTGVRIINNKARIAPEHREISRFPPGLQPPGKVNILSTQLDPPHFGLPQFAPGTETSAPRVLLHWAVRAAHTPSAAAQATRGKTVPGSEHTRTRKANAVHGVTSDLRGELGIFSFL